MDAVMEDGRMDPGQVAALEAALGKLQHVFATPGQESAEHGKESGDHKLTKDEKAALANLHRHLQNHGDKGSSSSRSDQPSQTKSNGRHTEGDMGAASENRTAPDGGQEGLGGPSATQASAAASMAAAAIQSAESAREAAASIARSMDAVLALTKTGGKTGVKTGGQKQESSETGQDSGFAKGRGEEGREGSAREGYLEMEEEEEDEEAEEEEKAEEASGARAGMAPTDRAELKRLRRALVHVQHQNHITHGVLAFMVAFSFVWRFGTMAVLHNMHHTVTRPFDFVGDTFNGIFRRKKGNRGQISMEGPNAALEAFTLPKLSSEEDSHTRAVEKNEEARQRGEDGSFLDFLPGAHGRK